jgi:uncharacterized protein YggT (Ycf19 family)
MTDYERTTVRETSSDGVVEPAAPVVARAGYGSDHVVTREASYRSGPTTGEVIRRVVMLLFGILQGLLILRVILLLLVANPNNDVVQLILGVTDPFVEPFRGMFSLDRITSSSGSKLDVAAIVALIGWTLVEALILAILSLGARRGEDATV